MPLVAYFFAAFDYPQCPHAAKLIGFHETDRSTIEFNVGAEFMFGYFDVISVEAKQVVPIWPRNECESAIAAMLCRDA